MTPDCLQAVCQPIRIHGDPSVRLFATVISANVSCRQFAASDGVISSVDPWAKLPIGVQSILPARFRVNPYYALQWVDPYAARSRVKLYYALQWVNLYAVHPQVNPYYTLQWVNLYAAHQRKNLYAVLPNLYAAHPLENLAAVRPNLYVVHVWVILYCTLKWENRCASCQWKMQNATLRWVNNKLILPAS